MKLNLVVHVKVFHTFSLHLVYYCALHTQYISMCFFGLEGIILEVLSTNLVFFQNFSTTFLPRFNIHIKSNDLFSMTNRAQIPKFYKKFK